MKHRKSLSALVFLVLMIGAVIFNILPQLFKAYIIFIIGILALYFLISYLQMKVFGSNFN